MSLESPDSNLTLLLLNGNPHAASSFRKRKLRCVRQVTVRVIFRGTMTDSLPSPSVRPTGGRSTLHHCGMVVAPLDGMAPLLSATASMVCPLCKRPVAPTADSTWVIAWYSCPNCGHEWSARIRNGRPDIPDTVEVPVPLAPGKERL